MTSLSKVTQQVSGGARTQVQAAWLHSPRY